MHRLRLSAVDSRYASQAELDTAEIDTSQIPIGEDGKSWQLAAHQVETIRSLRLDDAPIVINEAMTGDGKTLAGWFQLFSEKWQSFAMYPTNALAYDQQQGFNKLMQVWTPPNWARKPRHRMLSAYEIDRFSFGVDLKTSRKDKIEAMVAWKNYIQTNPDIFHLIMNFSYKQQGEASDFLPTFIANRFRLFIFDEFHLFGVEQIASVMIAMLLIKQIESRSNPHKFLFLSATPQSQLKQLATRVGLEIADPINGHYEHGKSQPSEGYRRILRETNLLLYSGKLEDWVKEQFEDVIKPFFMEHQSVATGLIIANSVATAHRIYAYLKPRLEPITGKDSVQINTGLTPKADRGIDFKLLVATSTVDVGVDFKINLLIFESRDAASHTQRLGRLGRHETDKYGNCFQVYEAHALLPDWVIEGVMQKFPEGSQVSREEYAIILQEQFSSQQDFSKYIHHWAGIQAGKLLKEMRDNSIYTQYKLSREVLEADFKALFGKSVRKYIVLKKAGDEEIIQEASSFRGGSRFTALIQDPETASQHIVSYNLMTLLRRADLIAIPKEKLLQEAQWLGQSIESLEKSNPLATYQLIGWREDYRDITIYLDTTLPEEKLQQIIVQNRFRIDCAGIPDLYELNKDLYDRNLVVFIIPNKDAYTVRKLLRIGFQLELFEFSDANGTDGTIAFGRDALLLESVYLRRKSQNAIFW